MATRILTFDEWLLKMYDFNANGKIDKFSERQAYKKALNNKNYQNTQQAYAQYVALTEATNKNEREAEQQRQLIEAAGSGNETASALLTGKTKGDEIKTLVLIGASAVVLAVLLIMRRKK